MESLKRCSHCRYQLYLTSFGPCKSKSDGLQPYCRDCAREARQKTYRKHHPDWKPRIPRVRRVPKFTRNATPEELAVRNNVTIMLSSAKRRARQRGIEFSLKREHIIIPDCCPALGVKLRQGTLTSHDCAPSLDRIDSSKGYTPDNIKVISCRANRIKTNATVEEIRLVYEYALTASTRRDILVV